VHIVQSTGRITYVQLFSMTFSLLTLTVNACRAFYIQRGRAEADPAPNPHMIWKVFPYMLTQVITNVVCWSVIALLKEYVFLTVAVSVLAVFGALTVYQRCCVPRENKDVEANPVDDIKPERLKEAPTKKVKAGTEEDDTPQEKLHLIIGEERNETEVDRSPKNTKSEANQIEVSEKEKYVEPEKRTSAKTPEAKQPQGEAKDAAENAQAIQNQIEDDDDLPSTATIWTTLSGFFGCLWSFWVCIFLPCVTVFFCCCSEFWESFLKRFKPGFFDFTDGLVMMMKEPVSKEDNRFFTAKAATTSVFVPCVIATGGNTFKLSAVIAWLVRTIALLVVGVLVLVQLPPSLHSRTTILFCGTNETVANLPRQNGTNETCVGWECFHICPLFGNCSLTHKLRICDDGDLTFIVSITLMVVLCQVLAVVSFMKLSALADYEQLWEASKGSWFGLRPIVHRSLIFKFITQKESSKLREVLQGCSKEAAQRQNPAGYAPITLAFQLGAAECLEELINSDLFDMNKKLDRTELTPIQAAVNYNRRDFFLKLSQLDVSMEGIDVSLTENNRKLFNLHLSLEGEDLPSLQLENIDLESLSKLLRHEGLKQVATTTGTTLVHLAIEQNDIALLEKVLQAGLETNTLDDRGLSPLFVLKPTNDHQMLEPLLKKGAVLRWWEDCHGLTTDGTSLIVNLAVEKRLDLLGKLFTNSRAAFPEKHTVGVSHKIFGRSDVGNSLENQEAVLLLVKNGLTNIDSENYDYREAEAMVARFKEQGGSKEVTAVPEQMWSRGEKRKSEPWSDRSAFKERGVVTGVRVRRTYGGSSIRKICLRHGGSWQPWRRTGSKEQGSEQEAFELEENEAVVAVRTNTGDYGWLRGLEITTSTGRKKSWGDLDKDYTNGEKRRSKVVNARLAFCSGAVQTGGNGRRLTFHWMME